MKKLTLFILLLIGVIATNSCRRDKYVPNICFKENIQPIFASKCGSSGCHDHNGDYNFTTYDGIMKAVTPYRPALSEAYSKLKGKNPEMPPRNSPQLTEKEKEAIRYWISFGAPNSSCASSSCDTSGTMSYQNNVKPIFDTWCIGCHSSGNAGGGFILDNYADAKKSVESGNLTEAIMQTAGFSPMPKNLGKLSDCDLATIRLWIQAGMPQ